MSIMFTRSELHGRRLLIAVVILSVIVIIHVITRREHLHTHHNMFCFTSLEDVLLSNSNPTPGRAIFFHETSCNHPDSQFHVLHLKARQACAIESAALHNPNFGVFVLFSCPTLRPLSIAQKSLIDAIESYPNVQFRQLNLHRYATGTPVENWVKGDHLLNSSHPMEHTSDLLRLISLYRYGGIYMDMDVVVLRSLEDVPLNYLGAQDPNLLCSAVMSLEPNGAGHEIAELFLRDYQMKYNGQQYTANGPALVTRVVRAICGVELVKAMEEDSKTCRGLKLFNSTAFYPIPWEQWNHYTEPKYLEDTMEKTKDSYLIHLWNKVSSRALIKFGSNTAYGKYAEKHCPKAYAAAGEYF